MVFLGFDNCTGFKSFWNLPTFLLIYDDDLVILELLESLLEGAAISFILLKREFWVTPRLFLDGLLSMSPTPELESFQSDNSFMLERYFLSKGD